VALSYETKDLYMGNLANKSLALTKAVIKEGWGLLVGIMSHLSRFIVMVLVFTIIFFGLKPFVSALFLLGIGLMGTGFLDNMAPMLTFLALPISLGYLVLPFWGAWLINRLMSKEHKARTRTKVIFWLILVISVVGALFKAVLSMSS